MTAKQSRDVSSRKEGQYLCFFFCDDRALTSPSPQIPVTEAAVASTKILKEEHNILVNLVFVASVTQASACASAGAAGIAMPVGKVSLSNVWVYAEKKLTEFHLDPQIL